jgi:hypothetical protein
MFPDPNNGAAFVPDSETRLVGSGERPGFLLVGLKMADMKLGKKIAQVLLKWTQRAHSQ